MAENENRVTYRCTAEELKEMDAFRAKYAPGAAGADLEAMRKLDRSVVRRATKRAVLTGVIGTLIFGAGLSMVLSLNLTVPGIILGCAGIAMMASMPALYGALLRREQAKAAPAADDPQGGANKGN